MRLVGTIGGVQNVVEGFKDAQRKNDKDKIDQEEMNPDSPLSKSMREQIGQVGIRIPETTSAAEMKKNSVLMKAVESAISGQQSLKNKAAEGAAEPKADQHKAALFGQRMQQAEGVFGKLTEQGYDPTGVSAGAQRTTVFGIGVPERLKSGEFKQQEQAERNFLNAVLRRESGAAISESEFDSGSKQYFPREGDTPEVLEQKRQNRLLAIQGLQAEAGPAWAKYSAPKGGPAMAKDAPAAPGGEARGATASQPSPEDVAAYKWAKANPKDPRAKAIAQKLKGKGL